MDSVLVVDHWGVVRLREQGWPQRVHVSYAWGGGFPIAHGCVVYDGEDPRDLGRPARLRPYYLAANTARGWPLGDRSAHQVLGSPDSLWAWLVERPGGAPRGGVARRVSPLTGEVSGEYALPDDARVAVATDAFLVLNRADARVTVWEPSTGADLLTVNGFATGGSGRYVVIVNEASYDPQPHGVLDAETADLRFAGLPLARTTVVSPDGRWLVGADDGGHPVLRAAEVGTGREVLAPNPTLRKTWFPPVVRWSRDGQTVYVVPHAGALLRWRPEETGLELLSDLPAVPFLLVE